MPVLHKYQDRDEYYVRTQIKNAVVTFQLSSSGQQKLLDNDLTDKAKFPLYLLSSLMRSGDAFTGGSGVELRDETEQLNLGFDFPEDEQAERLVPACFETGSFDDLHLVVFQQSGTPSAQILSPIPRLKMQYPVLLSIPLQVLDLKTLNKLIRLNKLPEDETADSLRCWFEEDMEAHWNRWRSQRAAKMQQLELLTDDEPALF